MISTTPIEDAILSTIINRPENGWMNLFLQHAGAEPQKLFVNKSNREIFAIAHNLVADRKSPTYSLILSRMEDGNNEYDDARYLLEEVILTPTFFTPDTFISGIQDLRGARVSRERLEILEQLVKDLQNDDIEMTDEDVTSELQKAIDICTATQEAQSYADLTWEVIESETPSWSQSTGIEQLDTVLGGHGFQSGTLNILAARAKVGKTAVMNSLVHSVLENGGVPLVLNFETQKTEFLSKMMARRINDPSIPWGLIKDYLMAPKSERDNLITSDRVLEEIEEALDWSTQELQQKWFVSFAAGMGTADITRLVNQALASKPNDANLVLFVDYLQIQVQDSRHEREELTRLTRFYKLLASQTGISVVLLSQLNRDGGKAGNLDVRHLRGSGSIEQDADTVLLLDRPHSEDDEMGGTYNGVACTGKNLLLVNAETTRLAEGDTFYLYIDHSRNLIEPIDENFINELLNKEDDEFAGYLSASV